MRLMGAKKSTTTDAQRETLSAGPQISDEMGKKLEKGLENQYQQGLKMQQQKRTGKRRGLGA